MTAASGDQLRKEARRARALARNMGDSERQNLLNIARTLEREADAIDVALRASPSPGPESPHGDP